MKGNGKEMKGHERKWMEMDGHEKEMDGDEKKWKEHEM